MPNYSMNDLHPAGAALFFDTESFLKDLSEEDESMLTGGRANSNSISRSGRVARIRRIRIIRRRRLQTRRRLLLRRRRRAASNT